jgi:hypothetical protein
VTGLGVVSLGEVGWSFRPVVWQDCVRLPSALAQELPYGLIHQGGMRAHGVVAGVIDPHHAHVRCIRFEPVELDGKILKVTHTPNDQGRYADAERRGCRRFDDLREEVRCQIGGLGCCRFGKGRWCLDRIGTIVVIPDRIRGQGGIVVALVLRSPVLRRVRAHVAEMNRGMRRVEDNETLDTIRVRRGKDPGDVAPQSLPTSTQRSRPT